MKVLIEVDTDTGAVRKVGDSPSAAPVDESWRDETGFPKLKQFGRAQFMMQAPTNPAWKISAESDVLGSQGAHLQDPSDPPGARSPSGFPVHKGRILYGQESYGSEAELFANVRATDARTQALVDGDAAAQVRNAVLQPGMLDMRTYNAEDLMFAGTFMSEIGAGKQGPRNIEKAFNNWWHDGTVKLPELPTTEEILERKHQSWDWSTYHGPVRALLPRLGD